jgi:hypothetical protein
MTTVVHEHAKLARSRPPFPCKEPMSNESSQPENLRSSKLHQGVLYRFEFSGVELIVLERYCIARTCTKVLERIDQSISLHILLGAFILGNICTMSCTCDWVGF